MYTVFDYTIQIDKGREFITRYQSDRDAQKIYAAMLQYRTTSTAAEINKTKIFDHLSSQQFDEQWSQGAVKFITYWQSQATAYNNLCTSNGDRIPDSMKLILSGILSPLLVHKLL